MTPAQRRRLEAAAARDKPLCRDIRAALEDLDGALARIAADSETIHSLRNQLNEAAVRERLAVMQARAHPEGSEQRT